MKIKNFKLKIFNVAIPCMIITIAALLRLLPHPANIAPIAAMALFGGYYLKKRYAIALPLLAMMLSDIFLGFSQSSPFVYGSFMLTVFLGIWLKKRKSFFTVSAASILSSILFFLITNFGYWLNASLYPKTFTGQIEAYIMALPFFRNTLIGDLLYTGLFFGGYEAVTAYLKMQRSNLPAGRQGSKP